MSMRFYRMSVVGAGPGTGSAGWLYRLMLETLLGVTREGGKLHFKPCLPGEWDRFALNYRYGETTYHIIVLRVEGESKAGIAIDGVDQSNSFVALSTTAFLTLSKSGSGRQGEAAEREPREHQVNGRLPREPDLCLRLTVFHYFGLHADLMGD